MKRAEIESQLGATQAALTRAEAEIISLRTTLAFYADALNYDAMFAPGVLDPQQGTWHVDGGDRARVVLEKEKA